MRKTINIRVGDILLQRNYPARNSREASFQDHYYVPSQMKVVRVNKENETVDIQGTTSGKITTYSLKDIEGHFVGQPCPNNPSVTDVIPVTGDLPNWHAPRIVDHFEPRLMESQASSSQKEEWTRTVKGESVKHSGSVKFGVESYESAKSRGAYTGSKADFERYSEVARANMRDAAKNI